MYWLRRIPAETRLVVLVVFLALFQAILLSVFGLAAIRSERRKAADNLQAEASAFLQRFLAQPLSNDLRLLAEEACRNAFDQPRPEWSDAPLPGGGLFTDAFLVESDGSVRATDLSPLHLPREVSDALEDEAREAFGQATERFAGSALGYREKAALDLELARRYPFTRGPDGEELSLLYAATPLMDVEGAPGTAALLRTRWIGLLNRLGGPFDLAAVDRFLEWVDRVAGEDPGYLRGRARQDRRFEVLSALVRELGSFPPDAPPLLHRNVRADLARRFFLRRVGAAGRLQVLAVDGGRLRGFLDDHVRSAAARAMPGLTPRLVERAPSEVAEGPRAPVAALPGWTATAGITPEAILARAGESERFYWYIIAFSIAGILAGGLLTARVVMREMRVAKLKSGFVSNVSHALKTPLTSIRMFVEMLRSGNVTEEAERRECLDVIEQETARLGTLIQQVLDFGRLSARRRNFRWRTGDLGALVRREAERFRRSVKLAPERFTVRVAVNLPPVTFDADAMAEVIANLLSNAYKYSPSANRRIELTLGPQRGRVVLAVADNGPGVAPRERRRIFERFYRADDLLARDVEGTGLGLSIARGIVRAHGGRVFVEDAEGGGSRFVVVIPAASRRGSERVPAGAEESRR